MSLLKQVLSIFVAVQMAVLPGVSYGQVLEANREKLENYEKAFAGFYDVRVDQKSQRAFLYKKGDGPDAKPAMEIPLEKPETLRTFSPKNIQARMLDEMVKIKAAGKGAWSHTMSNLPAESALFFIAMGALVAFELMTNHAQNPVAMQQHIEHQLSPLGVVSFGLFMLSQGFTSNLINMWTLRPSLLRIAPYLGMSFGMTIQTYFSEMAADPNVGQCLRQMVASPYPWMKRVKYPNEFENACENAYDTYVIHKKMWEMAPALTSMLLSSAVSAGAESLLAKGGRKFGISALVWLFPGGVQIKGMRWFVSRSTQIAGWGALDAWMNRQITRMWKNNFDGKELGQFNDYLALIIHDNKKSNWAPQKMPVETALKGFAQKMKEWRRMNLASVYEAHEAWQRNLGALNASYYSTYTFYQKFTAELNEKDEVSKLNRAYPLFGITATDLPKEKEPLYFTFPDQVEYLQIMNIEEVGRIIERKLIEGTYKSLGLHPTEIKTLEDLQKGLANSDKNVKTQAIKKVNAILPLVGKDPAYTRAFNSEIRALFNVLGKPEPLFEKGRGFGYTLETTPAEVAKFNSTKFLPVVGSFNIQRISDYMVASMICGPQISKGESVISMPKGFQAHFHAFSITTPHETKASFCGGQNAVMNSDKLYSLEVGPYKGAIEYIQDNVEPPAKYNFVNWWTHNTDAQIYKAYDSLKLSYNNIIENLFKGVHRTDLDGSNAGPIANGAMAATFQEARLYLLVLGEIFKDAYKNQYKKELPAEFFVPNENLKVSLSEWKKNSSKIPFLSLLSQESSLDFNSLINYKPGSRLQIQREIESQLAVINGLLRKISFVKDTSGKVIYVYSGFTKEQLDAETKNLEKSLEKFGAWLGVQEKPQAPTAQEVKMPDPDQVEVPAQTQIKSVVTLTKEQRQIAVTCLELIQGLSIEMTMYGQIANAIKTPEVPK